MKYILVVTLLAMSPLLASAQKNNTFADVGVTDLFINNHIPGMSVTYNWKLVNNFGVGVGFQECSYDVSESANDRKYQFTPGVFADLRGYLPHKKSIFFLLGDFGVDIYNGTNATNSSERHNNGFYTALGIGYCYRMTKMGGGPFVSLRIISDTYRTSEYYAAIPGTEHVTSVNGTGAITIGFKF